MRQQVEAAAQFRLVEGLNWSTLGRVLTANQLIGLLAEPERRRVIASLILAASERAALVERTGLSTSQVSEALDRLTSAGLIEEGWDGT